MKAILETAVAQPRFSMNQAYQTVMEGAVPYHSEQYQAIETALGKSAGKKVLQGIIRFAFFIEPVKTPKIESTKFAVRWGTEISTEDPRFASYSNCLAIYDLLLVEIQIALQDEVKKQLLRAFTEQNLIAYELPLDYVARNLNQTIHRQDNIYFFWDDLPRKIAGLREMLRSGAQANFFRSAYSKIVVKSHLTDRVLTGSHKTNREKRWETHPGSVHFALRRDCLEIELALISQLCYFAGFPRELQQELEEQGLLSLTKLQESGLIIGTERISRCPITLEPLSFVEFRAELLSPRHGKAAYQVGHIHPLKAVSDNPYVGHTGKNISWISAQGNRIQGEYSVAEIRELIIRISQNYQAAGLIN
ncbi:MAG: hypothetical protein IAE79_15310 [Anaerolinea sp.]|nr:hypothetical protein [Anaerolinea sp.]